jgi:hypothetical protein
MKRSRDSRPAPRLPGALGPGRQAGPCWPEPELPPQADPCFPEPPRGLGRGRLPVSGPCWPTRVGPRG